MKELIANVRANEALYKNLDVSFSTRYHLEDIKQPALKRGSYSSSDSAHRYVLQDNLVFYMWTEKGATVEESRFEHIEVRAYDGEYTRSVRNRALVNKVKGRPQFVVFRPHTWLLHKSRSDAPLSVLLSGGKELQTYPLSGILKNKHVNSTWEGEENVNGLPCVKIRIEAKSSDGKVEDIVDVWLATSRNYLPLRKLGFAPYYSKELPLEDATVESFREISAGVWFPVNERVTVYNERVIKKENKLKVQHITEKVVDKVSLEPNHDIKLFRDIEIPDGAMVYEFDGKKQVDAYIQGGGPPAPASTNKWSPWIIASVVLTLLVASGYFLRRRMRLRRLDNL